MKKIYRGVPKQGWRIIRNGFGARFAVKDFPLKDGTVHCIGFNDNCVIIYSDVYDRKHVFMGKVRHLVLRVSLESLEEYFHPAYAAEIHSAYCMLAKKI